VKEAPYRPGDSWKSVCKSLAGQIPLEGRLWLDTHPFPMLINRYKRKYFVTPDQKIRVTLDDDLSVRDQRYKSLPNFNRPANLPEITVLEVKFDRSERDRVSQMLYNIPVRISRLSKYISGLKVMQGF
jgi:hypothetical protein